MKKLRLLAVRTQQEALLKELQALGCVQISDPEPLLSDPELSPLLHRGTSEAALRRTEHAELLRGVKLLDQYAPEKKKLLSAKPLVAKEKLLDERAVQGYLEIAKKIDTSDDQIRRITVEESWQRSVVESMLPWAGLDLPLEYEGTESCAVMLGTLPASLELGEVSGALDAAAPESQLYSISTGPEQHYVSVICLRSEQEAALERLREFGYTPLAANGQKGTAREIISAAQERLTALETEKAALTESIAACADTRGEMKLCADRMGLLVERAEAAEKLAGTESAVVLTGWITAPDETRLTEALGKFDCAWELLEPEEDETPEVPVRLKNSWLTRPLNMVTEMYSLPAYGTVDPNPLMAPFFILFYGIMMADMGYGLLMILIGALFLKKTRPKGGSKHLFGLMVLCGVSTFIFGALTGAFLGDFLTQVVKLTSGKDFALPALFTPLDDTLMILVGSMALGFIHIVTGMAISVVQKCRHGQFLDALFNEITWWIIFAGLALMVLKVTPIVLYAGIALVVIGPLITGKGMGKITGIFSSIYSNVTGYFGDILSYSRLMALMLAGSVIAQVFNTLGAIPGNIVIFVIISLVGNALNFALNLLGCYVHDLRLQCLEYFGKFYQDGGKPFRPLEINTKFVDVE